MAGIKVNTDRVLSTAQRIKGYNNDIKNGISDMDSAIRRLNSKWDGPASSNAISKYNSIKNTFNGPRYTVVDNFVAFLHQQVGAGYESTENANKSLADQFK